MDGELSTFMETAGRSNGRYFAADGRLIACADEKNELWAITPDGKHAVVWKERVGRALNGPNDVWVDPDGGMYFTDPFYKRPRPSARRSSDSQRPALRELYPPPPASGTEEQREEKSPSIRFAVDSTSS